MIYFITLRAYDHTINLYVYIKRKLIPHIFNEALIRPLDFSKKISNSIQILFLV